MIINRKYKEFTITYSVSDPYDNIEHKRAVFIVKYPTFAEDFLIEKQSQDLKLSGVDEDLSVVISTLKNLVVYNSENIDFENCEETYLYVMYELYARYIAWRNSFLKFKDVEDLKDKMKDHNSSNVLLRYLSGKYNLPITDERLLNYTDEEAFFELANDIDKHEGDIGLEKLVEDTKKSDIEDYDFEELVGNNEPLTLEEWDRLKIDRIRKHD